MPLLTWQEFTVGGRPQGKTIPEDLKDFIENVSAVDRPALALLRRSKANTTYLEWLEDVLPARGHNAALEGIAHTDENLTVPTRSFTHVQTFYKSGSVSDTQRNVEHRGFGDALLYYEMKDVRTVLNSIEHTIHRGSPATGATSAARQTVGFLNLFTTNMTDFGSNVTLTEEVFNNLLQLPTDGGYDIRFSHCFVNSWAKRTISLYSTNVTRNVDAAARMQELVVDQYGSDFGDVGIFYARDQLKATSKTANGNSVVLLDPSFFETAWLTPLRTEVLARDGIRTRYQVYAQMGLVYRTEKAGGGCKNCVANI